MKICLIVFVKADKGNLYNKHITTINAYKYFKGMATILIKEYDLTEETKVKITETKLLDYAERKHLYHGYKKPKLCISGHQTKFKHVFFGTIKELKSFIQEKGVRDNERKRKKTERENRRAKEKI